MMNAVFIASVQGIKRGVRIGVVDNIDVAPTLAHLLGQPLPEAEGKFISEILSTPQYQAASDRFVISRALNRIDGPLAF